LRIYFALPLCHFKATTQRRNHQTNWQDLLPFRTATAHSPRQPSQKYHHDRARREDRTDWKRFR
jgi:hypothetical protein